MMTSDDPDQVMIQIQWWSKSSDDPDLVMMPHDYLDPVMMFHDDPDRVMIQIQSSDVDPDREMIQIQWQWIEDEDELKTQNTRDADDEMIRLI